MGTPLLHVGATVLCLHGGQAQPTSPNPRVKVGGQPVVTQAATYSIAACSFVAGNTPMPCVTGQYSTAALRVKVGGTPVLLATGTATCVPNGTGLNATVTQLRVTGT